MQKLKKKEEEKHYCIICGAKILDVHCKIKCQNCGYTRDCSDP
tara:strand:- start:1075 stop:1203 length:129 start_codon:yes stop_codon:yes gene_type:complete